MERIASGAPELRHDLFMETANLMGVEARIVEKDFWVCWALKQLFSLPQYANHFLFKGGTTLSKVFHVINRFSEDVDIAVNWVPLGFTGERDPMTEMSKTRRSTLLSEMLEACRAFIAGDLRAALEGRFAGSLNQDWQLEVDPDNRHVLLFRYPKALSLEKSYVKDPVALELGTHAEWIPHGEYDVVPYASEKFPDQFERASVRVRATRAERTFWEKATILHAEHHRPEEKVTPPNYSRHYYDTIMLGQSEHGSRALRDLELLERVVAHKQMFYPAAWCRYELAVPGSMRLLPAAARRRGLIRDYAQMEIMFFGPRPSFEEILGKLEQLERRINAK